MDAPEHNFVYFFYAIFAPVVQSPKEGQFLSMIDDVRRLSKRVREDQCTCLGNVLLQLYCNLQWWDEAEQYLKAMAYVFDKSKK
jgi:hypothetical protein